MDYWGHKGRNTKHPWWQAVGKKPPGGPGALRCSGQRCAHSRSERTQSVQRTLVQEAAAEGSRRWAGRSKGAPSSFLHLKVKLSQHWKTPKELAHFRENFETAALGEEKFNFFLSVPFLGSLAGAL